MISSLRRFNKEGAEDLYVTQGGFMLTKWEARELKREQKVREKKLTQELNKLKEPSKYSNVGASRYEMGSERAREIEHMLTQTNLEMLERAEDLNRFLELKNRIHKLGSEDYYIWKSQTFKENWLNALSHYSHFDNYDLLVKRLKSIKDPQKFFDTIQNSELGMDFLNIFYDNNFTQQQFNSMAEDLGVNGDELIDSAS